MNHRHGSALLVACLALFAGIVYSLGHFLPAPYAAWPAQDPLYHRFADQRAWLGTANAGDVLSNVPFLVVGFWGLWAIARRGGPAFLTRWEQGLWLASFIGVVGVGLGSGWYHLRPNNQTLVWDRLPMAVVFALLLAVAVHERVTSRLAGLVVTALLVVSVGSVAYWALSEVRGVGDVRPYFLVQLTAMIALPLIVLLFPARYTRAVDWWRLAAFYLLAKALEAGDLAIFRAAGGWVSGHTLKHLAAAGGAACLALHVGRREARGAQAVRSH